MNHRRRNATLRPALPLLVLVPLLAAPAAAQPVADDKGFVRLVPGQEQRKNPFGVGVMVAAVHGDPSKPGIYVIRIKWPKGVMSRPHSHPEDRHVVVLSGTWYAGTGEAFAPETAVPLKAGAYMLHPAGAVHWDGTRDDEAVIQITGYGPSGNVFVRPDEPPFAKE
jgi:quercetin dioxygenase-like cupin family protein